MILRAHKVLQGCLWCYLNFEAGDLWNESLCETKCTAMENINYLFDYCFLTTHSLFFLGDLLDDFFLSLLSQTLVKKVQIPNPIQHTCNFYNIHKDPKF